MPRLPVRGLPRGDNGRLLVRLSYKCRNGIKRFGIGRITNNANQQALLSIRENLPILSKINLSVTTTS